MKIPLLLLNTFLISTFSYGLGVRVVDQDAAATGRAEAWTATADNPAAIFYNPAGITQLDGLTARLGVYAIGIHEHFSSLDGGDGLEAKEKIQYVPQFYSTYHIKNSPVTVGLGFYAPFGFELDYPDRAPFRTLAKFGSIKFETAEPVVAVQITRSLSVAAGLTVNHVDATLKRGLFAPGDTSPTALPAGGDEFDFKGSGTQLGVNAGIMWKPTPQHSFGVSYHSAVQVDLSGHSSAHFSDKQVRQLNAANAQISAANTAIRQIKATVPAQFQSAALASFGLPSQEIAPLATSFSEEDANAGFHFPQYVMAGYSFRPTPDWNFELDLDWTDWDSLNTVTLHQQRQRRCGTAFQLEQLEFIYEFGVTRKLPLGLRASVRLCLQRKLRAKRQLQPNRAGFKPPHFQRRTRADVSTSLIGISPTSYTYGPTREVAQGTLADGTLPFRQPRRITLPWIQFLSGHRAPHADAPETDAAHRRRRRRARAVSLRIVFKNDYNVLVLADGLEARSMIADERSRSMWPCATS